MPIYAQLDENSIVIGISDLSGEVSYDHMIRIPAFDISLINKKYENGQFVDGPPLPPEPRYITIGAFKDRLGVNALSLAVSTNPICAALKEMLYDRKYIDLDRTDLAQYMQILVDNNLPEASPYFPGSAPLTQDYVNTILSAPVQDYERP